MPENKTEATNDNPEKTKQSEPQKKKPPEINPYIFPFLLAAFGLWCLYDGWITTNPEMQEHALFNRVVSFILLPWAVYDFIKQRKYDRKIAEPKMDVSESATKGPTNLSSEHKKPE